MVSQAVKRASLEELDIEFQAIGHELVDGDLQSVERDLVRSHALGMASQIHRVRMRLAFLLTNASKEVRSVGEALGSVSGEALKFFGFYQ